MRRLTLPALALLLSGCGGGDSSESDPIPEGAATMQTYAQAGITLLAPGLGRLDALLPFLLNPGSPGSEGIVFQADLTPGAPPNSYVFTVPVDGDGDGTAETVVAGHAVLSDHPSNVGVGFGGSVELSVTSVGGLGDFGGAIEFMLTARGTELSGTGTFSEMFSGNSTEIHADPAHPLVVAVATGASGSAGNACAYSLDGDVDVDVSGPLGILSSLWSFSSGQKSIQVTDATYMDPQGVGTELPDSRIEIPCGGGSIQDWAGVYVQNYSCIPPEYGQARLTLTVTGSDRIHIVDEDPPDSGNFNAYDATVVSGNPHVVRGFFIAGPPGNTYREDFSWTLTPSGDSFSQVSTYTYREGAMQGTGGLCSAAAVREP